MKFIESMRSKKPSSAVAYHLEGILEALDSIRSLVEDLGESQENPADRAEKLTKLQLEIYAHLALHMKELRRPLRRVVDAAYKGVAEASEDDEIESAKELMKSLARTIKEQGG